MLRKEMKAIVLFCLFLFVFESAVAGFHYPQDRVPIKVVGEEGKRLDEIRISQIDFEKVAVPEAFRQVVEMLNAASGQGAVPFEIAIKLSAIESLSKSITLRLTNVSGTEALQYVTALAGSHFSINENLIVVIPVPEKGFGSKDGGKWERLSK